MEAPDDFDFGSNGRSLITPARKRKSTVGTDPEDHALRTKAWAGNRGFVSYSFSFFCLPLSSFPTSTTLFYSEITIRTFWCLPPTGTKANFETI